MIYNCAVPDRATPSPDRPIQRRRRWCFSAGSIAARECITRLPSRGQLQRRLIIAGNISPLAHEQAYFKDEIQPRIDGDLVTYIGPVGDEAKQALLGGAAAMLMPIEWEEPFPVVLPESMLCGTPLIAFRRGGVPEGIDHGRTGFLCDTPDEMAALVSRLPEIDRAAVRAEAVKRFSDSAIAGEYEQLYRQLAASPGVGVEAMT